MILISSIKLFYKSDIKMERILYFFTKSKMSEHSIQFKKISKATLKKFNQKNVS